MFKVFGVVLILLIIGVFVSSQYVAPYDNRDLNNPKYEPEGLTGKTPTSYDSETPSLDFLNWLQPSFKNINILGGTNITITNDSLNSAITISADINAEDINGLSEIDANKIYVPYVGATHDVIFEDNINLCLGNNGCSDAYIVYNGSNLYLYDSSGTIIFEGIGFFTGLDIGTNEILDFGDGGGDAYISYDGDSLNLVANNNNATDDFEITADYLVVNADSNFFGTIGINDNLWVYGNSICDSTTCYLISDFLTEPDANAMYLQQVGEDTDTILNDGIGFKDSSDSVEVYFENGVLVVEG